MAQFEIDDFRKSKSVIPNFKFQGAFTNSANVQYEDIKPWHIRSVSYEQHTFKQEGQYHGPGILKTFPVLERGENGAYILRVTFEEDAEGTILKFIEFVKRKVINENGVYNILSVIKDLNFELTLLHTPKKYELKFQNIYFLTAESSEYSYGDTDIKTYTVSFAYDNYIIDDVQH